MIHHHLYRARLALLAAALFAGAVVVAEFPLSMLLHQRSQIALVSAQLGQLQSRNAGLAGDVKALSQNSTVAEIAHEEYGLVSPGQRSYVILPSNGSPAANDLSVSEIPPRDLVASTPAVATAPRPSTVRGPGLWSRFLTHLEFWRSGN